MSIKANAFARPGQGGARGALLALAALALATGAGFLLAGHAALASQALVYVLAVVVVAHRASLAAALACTAGALALFNFFFVPPRFDVRIDAQENIAVLVAMLAVTLVISQRSAALRREAAAARLAAQRAGELQQLAMELAEASQEEHVQAIGRRILHRSFSQACDVELAAGAPWVPDADGSRVPLLADGRVHGAARIPGLAGTDPRTREHARAICALLAQALRRVQLGASARAAEERARWHRAQSTFLSGISHELRSPLAPIVTAASALLTQRGKLEAAEQQRLTQVIVAEAAHLTALTENTLHLARLENPADLCLDWQSLEEIVGAVLRRVRQRDPARRIACRVPANLPLVKGDAVLLAQLLDNLLDNALRYSAEGIELVVNPSDVAMEVTVLDRGGGIPAGQAHTLFEPRHEGTRQRPAGIGLAVGRAIARAHGGELLYRPREGGGSSFTVRLPLAPVQPDLEPA